MWTTILNILKKAAKYGAIAVTGYEIGDEIGDEISSTPNQILKETTITKEQQQNNKSEIWFIYH